MPKYTVTETATELPQLIDALNTHAIDKVELTVEGKTKAVLLSYEVYTKLQTAVLEAQIEDIFTEFHEANVALAKK